MDKFNNYYDASHPLHPYTHSLAFTEGSIPPVNALRGPIPTSTAGYHPGEKNGKWIAIEDHRGKKGYLDGQPHEIKEYGPLPEGWSDTPPPPTADQLFAALRTSRDARLAHTDKMLLPDYPINADGLTQIKVYRAALRDLPDQPGSPWDGGGELTPWPELPSVG